MSALPVPLILLEDSSTFTLAYITLLKATTRILHHILVFQLTSHLHQVPGNWNSLTFSGNTLPYNLSPHSCILLVAHCHPTTEQAVPVILFMLTATKYEANIPRFDSQDHDL